MQTDLSGRWCRGVALISVVAAIGAGLGATALSASAASSDVKNVTVARCGILHAPAHPKFFQPKELGIYIAEGHVSCVRGKSLITMAFQVAGKDTGAGDTERYPNGWVCGGQMGYYGCEYPASQLHTGRFTASVQARECNLGGVKCPRKIKTELPSALRAISVLAHAANQPPVLGIRSAFIGGFGFGQAQPRTVGFGGDATTYFARVRWRSWGSQIADGTGSGSCLPPNKPPVDGYICRVQLYASDLSTCHGRRAYQRLSVFADYSSTKRVRYANRVDVCTHHD
jgi:hypothetical protein